VSFGQHSRPDRTRSIEILRGSDAAGQDPIGQAYRFFRSHVELLDPVAQPLNLEHLTRVVVERLAVLDSTTGQGDFPAEARSTPTTGHGPRPPGRRGEPRRGAGQRGPPRASWPPTWTPRKQPVAGEKVWGSAIRSLWGRKKCCHNGGMAFAPPPTLAAEGCRPEGSAIGIMAPRRGPQEAPSLQGKRSGGPRSAPGAAMDSSAECGLAPLRVRGLERVALHADLVMLARLSQALARAAGRPARRIESGRHDSQRRHSERRWPAGGPHSASPRDVEPVERTSREC